MTQPPVKLLVVFYSTYGTNLGMAREAAQAAEAAGAQVRLRRAAETAPQSVVDSQEPWKANLQAMQDIPAATPDDMEWADGFVFSTPTQFGGAASQMRAFIDTLGGLWAAGKLAGKTFSAMTSAQNPNGGQETTLQTLYVTAMHWGAILVPPGYTHQHIFASGGNPYGASVTANGQPLSDEDRHTIRHQVARQVELTRKLLS
ncbi:NAD(P)H:quinone oxidoreductase [Deinococcus enclensis]|uniref:NAD(P)H dehydrogenase (Quinone) n=1 Tax=Deinococcus enclensis TaxID=1049582 RepID=A0ABT9MC92_9DEIO|nr:NAD(P)H:quinone oxidoreductase [Deinococcus enclensis]MDP9764191.1 NAD(P)H dehydrogenase (quinone) [Deinococcus enclensis]